MSKGGITTRTGGNPVEIYKSESSAPTPQQSTSKSWLGKTWDWLSGEGGGKLANYAAKGLGAGIGYLVGGTPGAAIGSGIANYAKNVAGDIIGEKTEFGKGLMDKKADENAAQVKKAFNLYKNGSLTTDEKIKQFQDLVNTSNGHVPVGYQATSSPSASNTSSLLLKLNKKQEKRKNKKKHQQKKKDEQWGNYFKNQKGKKAKKTK